jgi:dTMP kinase
MARLAGPRNENGRRPGRESGCDAGRQALCLHTIASMKKPARPAKTATARAVRPAAAKPRGMLVSFEGSEGSGKSTQIMHLAERLQELGLKVVSTREPGGTEIGEQIRNILVHNSKGDEMCAETELLLFAASRAQLVREVIAPNLMRGTVVLCDRYIDSSTVYQGVARNLSLDPVQQINQFAVGNVLPDLTIVLDVPTRVSLNRINLRASDLPDRMERENIAFYKKVRDGYLVLARSLPKRFFVVNGTLPEDKIAKAIWTEVKNRLGV